MGPKKIFMAMIRGKMQKVKIRINLKKEKRSNSFFVTTAEKKTGEK